MTDDNEWGNLLDSESLSRSNSKISWTAARKQVNTDVAKTDEWKKALQESVDQRDHKPVTEKRLKSEGWKKQQEWFKDKMESRRGKPNDWMERAVVIYGVEYRSLTAAGKAQGINTCSVGDQIRFNPDFCYYVDVGPVDVYVWFYVTPNGNFSNAIDAGNANNITAYALKKLILDIVPGYSYKQLLRTDKNHNRNAWKKGTLL